MVRVPSTPSAHNNTGNHNELLTFSTRLRLQLSMRFAEGPTGPLEPALNGGAR